MAPTDACAVCKASLACGWTFAEADLHCPLCGDRVVEARPNGGPVEFAGRHEVWGYADDGGTVNFRLGLTRDHAGRSRLLSDADFVDWSRCGVELFAKTTVRARLDRGPDGRSAVLRLPDVGRLPPDGLAGRMRLTGLTPAEWPIRLFPAPAEWLTIAPAGPPGAGITALLDRDTRRASFTITLRAPVVPVAVCDLTVTPGTATALKAVASGLKVYPRRPVLQPVTPDRPLQLSFLIADCTDRADGLPFAIEIHLNGRAQRIPFAAPLALRTKPAVRLTPGATAARELEFALGGPPAELDFYLTNASGPEAAVPALGERSSVEVDPPEHAAWLSQAADLPPTLPADPDGLLEPTRLRMRVDTSRLSRDDGRFAGVAHSLTLIVRDTSGYELAAHQLQVRFARMRQHDGVIGFDWGTTNNCAAIADGPDLRSLALNPDDPDEFERFPSAFFVREVPADGPPVLAVGTDGHELIELSEHRQCVVRGLKRRFLAGGDIRLRDPLGRERDFPVDEVAAQYLLQTAEYLERLTGKELGFLGLTYPTKWPAAARERLERVLARVRRELEGGRPGRRIELLPPVVDEATAVALSTVREVAADPAAPAEVTVIAYDFGGGTIDTVILRISLTDDDRLTTTLVGVGGRPDFGGDDITRAVVRLLRDRMSGALAGIPSTELPVLLAEEGDRTDRPPAWNTAARQNAERLWRRAEEIKRGLCRPDADAPDPVTAALDRIELDQLRVFRTSPASDLLPLGTVLQPGDQDLREAFVKSVWFGLDEVYAAPVVPGATIRGRLEETFAHLAGQLAELPTAGRRVVVLAGGACRLPLVGELASATLLRNADDRLDYRASFAKQRVAHGNAWYLWLRQGGQENALSLSLPSGVTHRPLAFVRRGIRGETQAVVVPAGSPIHAPAIWYDAEVRFDAGRHLYLWTREWRRASWTPVRVGEFARTPVNSPPDDSLRHVPLPEDLAGSVAVGIRLVRSADPGGPYLAQMRVRLPGQSDWCGPYPLLTDRPEADICDLLQGILDE